MPRPLHLFHPTRNLDTAPLRAGGDADHLPLRDGFVESIRRALQVRAMRDRLHTLHTWDPAALAVLSLAPRAWPLVHHLASAPTPSLVRWLMWTSDRRHVHVRCLGTHLRSRLVAMGFPESLTELTPPPVSASPPSADRATLRMKLGLGDDERLLLIPGPATLRSGHRAAMHVAVLVHVYDPRHRTVLWGIGPFADVVRRHAQRLSQPRAFIDAAAVAPDLAADDLAHAADAVLVGDAEDPPRVSIARAGAVAPVLLPPTRSLDDLAASLPRAWRSDGARPRAMAMSLLERLADLHPPTGGVSLPPRIAGR